MKAFANWCRRYISLTGLIVIAAVVYMVFFQENSMTRIYDYERTIDSLQQVIAVQNDTMEHYRSLNQRLDENDRNAIERVARENFNMARENEDIYVFE